MIWKTFIYGGDNDDVTEVAYCCSEYCAGSYEGPLENQGIAFEGGPQPHSDETNSDTHCAGCNVLMWKATQ